MAKLKKVVKKVEKKAVSKKVEVEKPKSETLYAVVLDYMTYHDMGPLDTPERQAGLDSRYQKLKEMVKAK